MLVGCKHRRAWRGNSSPAPVVTKARATELQLRYRLRARLSPAGTTAPGWRFMRFSNGCGSMQHSLYDGGECR